MSSTRSRSSSRSRTMIGIFVAAPRGRTPPACRRRSCGSSWRRRSPTGRAAPPWADRPESPARAGLRRGRRCALRLPARRSIIALRVHAPRAARLPGRRRESRARCGESPPPSRRFACWLPPEARVVMMTPGMTPASWRFRSRAICSLDRVALVLGHQPDRHAGRGCRRRRRRRSRRRRRPGSMIVHRFGHVLLGERLRAAAPRPRRARCACRPAARR